MEYNNCELKKEAIIIDSSKNQNCEKDRCEFAWENLYKKYYNVTEPDYKGVADFKVEDLDLCCPVSGDVTFNFAEGKGRNCKYEKFRKIIENDNDIDDNIRGEMLNKLGCCKEMNYSLENLTLMITTGSLQLIKNNQGGNLDRPDTFLNTLDKYYKLEDEEKRNCNDIYGHAWGRGKNEEIKKERTEEIRKALFEYLKKINNVITYCKYFWLIDNKEFVEEMMCHGERSISNAQEVDSYMNIAIKFWQIRKENFKKYNMCL